jgi:heptosyltransferase-3
MSTRQKKILVFAKPAIGDILLATPLMRSIRQAEPAATIDVMCYPGQDGILEGNPDIDNIVVIPPKPSIRELFALGLRLYRKYDIAITNAADDRVHLYLLFFGKTRVSVTLKDGAAWKRWITKASALEDSKSLHALLRNNRLGNLLGYESHYEIQLPQHGDMEKAEEVLAGVRRNDSPYAVLHVDARLPYKRWTPAGWCDVLQYFSEQGIACFITGGPSASERDYIAKILSDAPDFARSLAGQLSFADVTELIRGCRIYLGIDTVISHLAAAVGVPTVALFGPESPVRWGPWPKGYAENQSPWHADGTQRINNVLIIQGNKGCDTCVPGDCKGRYDRGMACPLMTGISSERVIAGLRDMLE